MLPVSQEGVRLLLEPSKPSATHARPVITPNGDDAKPVDEQTQRLDTHRSAARLGLIGHDGAAPATPGNRPVPLSSGFSHVTMNVPEGTLTEEYRARLLEFYGRMLGWREMESLRLPDRLTVAVGSSSISASESGPTAWCLTVKSTLASLSARRRSS